MTWLYLLLSFIFLSPALQAKHLYVFIGTDTLSNIQSSCFQDGKRVTQALTEIGERLQMEVRLTSMGGKKLTPAFVEKWLEEINPSSDDVVFFYFSGHGNRSKNKTSRWPSMLFPSTKEHLSLRRVINSLKRKKAHLTLILCDCCNNTPVKRTLVPQTQSNIPNFTFLHPSQNVDTLFSKTKGMIIASASSPGSRAWNTLEGGIFTTSFLYSLQKETLKSSPNWKAIFKQTESIIHTLQKPQVKLEIFTKN